MYKKLAVNQMMFFIKSHLVKSLGLIILAVNLCFCTGDDIDVEDDSNYVSIRGNTYFQGTTIPVMAVTVEIGGYTYISYGEFRIDSLIPGVYTIKAHKPEYNTYISEVELSFNITNMDIPMTSEWMTTTLYGSISGEYRGPKPGISVIIINPDGSHSDLLAITGSDGTYKIPLVPQGDRRLVLKYNDEVLFETEINLPYRSTEDYQYDIVLREPFEFVDNRDGKKYQAMEIGDQTWMVENLAFLPAVNTVEEGNTEKAYYYVYGDSLSNVAGAKESANYQKYGVLYNWEAARISCPDGWHLPDDNEFDEMISFVSPSEWGPFPEVFKSKSGWYDNKNGNNSSGFNAFPAGIRSHYGKFEGLTEYTIFWSSSGSSSSSTGYALFYYRYGGFGGKRYLPDSGFSVRCVQD